MANVAAMTLLVAPAVLLVALGFVIQSHPRQYGPLTMFMGILVAIWVTPFAWEQGSDLVSRVVLTACVDSSAIAFCMAGAFANGMSMQSMQRARLFTDSLASVGEPGSRGEVNLGHPRRRLASGWTRSVVLEGSPFRASRISAAPEATFHLACMISAAGAWFAAFAHAPIWWVVGFAAISVSCAGRLLLYPVRFAGVVATAGRDEMCFILDPWRPRLIAVPDSRGALCRYATHKGTALVFACPRRASRALVVFGLEESTTADGVPVLSRQQWNRLRWFGLLPAGVRRRTADLGRTA